MQKGSVQIIVPKLNLEWNKTKCVQKQLFFFSWGAILTKKDTRKKNNLIPLKNYDWNENRLLVPRFPKSFWLLSFFQILICNPKIIQHIFDYLKMFPSYGGMHNTRCFPSHSFNTLHWELFPCSNMAIAEDWRDSDFLMLQTNLKSQSWNCKYLEYLGSIPSLYCRDKCEKSLLWTSLS